MLKRWFGRFAVARLPLFSTPFVIFLCSSLLGACGSDVGTDASQNPASQTSTSLQSVVTAPATTNDSPVSPGQLDAFGVYQRAALFPHIKVGSLQYVPTHSGHPVAVRVTLPAEADGKPATGPFPVILVQSAYNVTLVAYLPLPGGSLVGAPDPFLVRRGYAQVSVDVIGSGVSGGGWEMLGAEEQSGYGDVVDWIKQQPWSNGDIGVAGASYMAITGLFTAEQRPDDIKAIFAAVPMGDAQRGTVGIGGLLNATFMSRWMTLTHFTATQTIPAMIQFPTFLQDIMGYTREHITQIDDYYLPVVERALNDDPAITYDGEFWRTRSPLEHIDQIQAPTFVVGALNDIFQRDAPLIYEALKDRVDSRLIIYDGSHLSNFLQGLPGTEATAPLQNLMLQWFDHYLLGLATPLDNIPPVTQYVTNYHNGFWQGFATASDWPHPAATPERWYLHGDQSLRRQQPEFEEPGQTLALPRFSDYHYGKTAGGNLFFLNIFLTDGSRCSPSYEQWTLGSAPLLAPNTCYWNRNGVENFTVNFDSEPMTEPYYINGPIQADLWIKSTNTDAVLAVRVDELKANGQVVPLTDGMLLASMRAVNPLRSRYLHGEMIQPYHYLTQEAEQLLVPGEPTLVQVEIFPASAIIRKGSRLRVSIAPSNQAQGMLNLPRRERVSGGITTVLNSVAYPSSVVVPAVPMGALD